MSLLLNVIIRPLHIVAAIEKHMAYGLPVAVPCHTASITPIVSTTSEAASFRVGYFDSTMMASPQATTGMADRII